MGEAPVLDLISIRHGTKVQLEKIRQFSRKQSALIGRQEHLTIKALFLILQSGQMTLVG
jgi:hypothetical protein